MGIILKGIAVLLVIGGLWVWVTGRSVTDEREARVDSVQLSAASILAPGAENSPFDEEGTIVFDATEGQTGTPYLLYTDYNEQGKPSVKTKRLIFSGRAVCAEVNLPCATNQPGVPVYADQAVRVTGWLENEQVEVEELYAL